MGGLVAQAGRIGAQLAGALQGDGHGVEGAHEQHLLEQLAQAGDIAPGLGQVVAHQGAVGAQVLEVFDLEACGDAHLDGVLVSGGIGFKCNFRS